MTSAIDQWMPPKVGSVEIDWIKVPKEITQRWFKAPVFISARAREACMNGDHPEHRAKDEQEAQRRYEQVFPCIAVWGRTIYRRAHRGDMEGEQLCCWSPVPQAKEFDHPRHRYQVPLCVSVKRVFNGDVVVLIALWEELHPAEDLSHG